ncbi:IucA/IucC family protein [Floridanema aerugineum]|uniref:IucA/IucC family siderophore biosynthesis protein n=1 Tax=Floridaenema aerugineum BLCC-F46 TaxID=3153654 RepID=A0ABV4X3J9_9CYAN
MQHLTIFKKALHPQNWETINRNLLAKMLSEFMYEQIITPEIIETTNKNTKLYQLPLASVVYRFVAKTRLFNSYRVIPETIKRQQNNTEWEPATQVLQFILDLHETIGMNPITTAHFIREISNTLLADAHIYVNKETAKTNLLNLNYAELEGEMEGHPWITFNKGRIGFNYQDYLNYTPEQKQSISFLWIASRKDKTKFNAVSQLSYDKLLQEELGESQINQFQNLLIEQGLNPDNYYFFPIHDWQFETYLASLFAEEIATNAIVILDRSPDNYLPQQSIRTFLNISNPQKRNVKLPISIFNTSTYRGLPAPILAPYMTEWLKDICDRDSFLTQKCRLILLGEVAGMQYFHPYYINLKGTPYQYREMLGCLWRESVFNYLEPKEKPITLASLLHLDYQGKPFISQLVEQSDLSLSQWLKSLFNAVLPPLLHYLYRYGTVFSPHGENVILILQDNIPVRVALKDFLDDVNISEHPFPELESFPSEIKPFFAGEKDEKLCQYIFCGLFICHFRYLSDLLETYHQYDEQDFWLQVREVILNYQAEFPELRSRFTQFDLLSPSFSKLCLNRTRLLAQGYADESGNRPAVSTFGTVSNALDEVVQIASIL